MLQKIIVPLSIIMIHALGMSMVNSFMISPISHHRQHHHSVLFARRKGDLMKNLDSTSTTSTSSKKSERKRSSTSISRKSNKIKNKKAQQSSSSSEAASPSSSKSISPAISQWAASVSSSSDSSSSTTKKDKILSNDDDDDDDASIYEYSAFEQESSSNNSKGSSSRRERQSARKASEAILMKQTQNILDELEEEFTVEKNRDLEKILSLAQKLISQNLQKNDIQSLIKAKEFYGYKLVWAGSDEAICHIGTGLHKVPLARLQEVFLNIGNKAKIEMYEVIRILGPFPNVKNTLLGDVSIVSKNNKRNNNNNEKMLDIQFNSMIDGTGKEILAGTSENIRNVDLSVLYASEQIVICKVPDSDDDDDEEEKDDGSNLLIFFQEVDVEAELELLRV